MNARASVSLLERFPGARADLDCPECGAPLALIVDPKQSRPFYGCCTWRRTGCPGSHTAHPDGSPVGIPANEETKKARRRAHVVFDRMWRGMGMERDDAYRWMQKAMGLTADEAHIGCFTIIECEKLIATVEAVRERGRRHRD